MKSKLRLLIVDDDRRMTSTLADILFIQGHETVQAHSGVEALQVLQGDLFDCVLTDVKMPGMNGVELYRELHKNLPGLPVVLMTAYAADDLLRSGLEEGALGVLNKPLDLQQLLSFLTLLGSENVVTVVDDDPEFCQTLAEILEFRGFHVAKITDPQAGVELMAAGSLIILLDIRLNTVSGLDLLREIHQAYPDLPVLLVTGYRDEAASLIANAGQIGAQTCLYKPLEIPTLLHILENVQLQRLRPLLNAY
jgi:CheY-like chemotaxis protein